MDNTLVLVLVLALLFCAGAAVFALVTARRAGTVEAGLAEQFVRLAEMLKAKEADLDGRLKQLAETQAATQTALADRLHAQERQLSEALDKRLGEMTNRLHLGLEASSTKTLETMGKLEARLAVIDEAQKNIQELGAQIVGLQDILGNKQAQGAFGETRLETLIADMLPPSAYAFQATLANGKRVDCLIKLPQPPGPVPVDAKFPLSAYEQLQEAGEETAHIAAQRAFRAALTQHIKDIQSKYILPGQTADWALMFLPSEAIYGEIHANFRDLVELSHRAHVLMVSPTTLWATLLGVRAVLKDARMHEQASMIRGEVLAMVEDIKRLVQRTDNLRRHFGQAESDLKEIETSARKVGSRAERIGAVEIEAPEAEAKPRLVSGGD